MKGGGVFLAGAQGVGATTGVGVGVGVGSAVVAVGVGVVTAGVGVGAVTGVGIGVGDATGPGDPDWLEVAPSSFASTTSTRSLAPSVIENPIVRIMERRRKNTKMPMGMREVSYLRNEIRNSEKGQTERVR